MPVLFGIISNMVYKMICKVHLKIMALFLHGLAFVSMIKLLFSSHLSTINVIYVGSAEHQNIFKFTVQTAGVTC